MSKNKSIENLLAFVDASPTPFHAVQTTIAQLKNAGAVPLKEQDTWELKPNTFYYITRNDSSLAAFKTPRQLKKNLNFSIIAAHTDSPCLKLKPHPKTPLENYNQWGVEVYGGALNNSWLDRDLGVSGRITYLAKNKRHTKFVTLDKQKIRIPQLAIHLDQQIHEDGLKLNPQVHLSPILSLDTKSPKNLLLDLLGPQAPKGVTPNNILAFDLFLHDTLASSLGGLNNEFIYAPRLDNLAMCHASLEAILSTSKYNTLPVMFLFDNEEVGSGSAQGAGSNFLPTLLERIHLSTGFSREDHLTSLARSFIISADMAHAFHPNYPDRHDANHRPLMGKGPVIKGNAKLRYSTTSETSGMFIELCRKARVPYQQFVNRTDLACGSTLGPIISTLAGIPSVDVGSPMLSMHSAREMTGCDDHVMMIKVMQEFYKQ